MPKIPTVGDGNCAFNAFALGLCHLIVLGNLDNDANNQERKTKIISLFESCNIKFGNNENADQNTTWESLKKYLNNLKTEKDLQNLQISLGDSLRNLSIENIKKNLNNPESSPVLERLQERLKSYFYLTKSEKESFDDMFSSHKFIKNSFDSFSSETELLEWWTKTGLTQFLNAKQDPNNRDYAGDFELMQLCENFWISVEYTRANAPSTFLTTEEHFPKIHLYHTGGAHWECEVSDKESDWLQPLLKPSDNNARHTSDQKPPKNKLPSELKSNNPIDKPNKNKLPSELKLNNPTDKPNQNKLSGNLNSENSKWTNYIKTQLKEISDEHAEIKTKINTKDKSYEVYTLSDDEEVLEKMVQKAAEVLNTENKNITVEVNGPHKTKLIELCRKHGFIVTNELSEEEEKKENHQDENVNQQRISDSRPSKL